MMFTLMMTACSDTRHSRGLPATGYKNPETMLRRSGAHPENPAAQKYFHKENRRPS
jgi:hypothetical protein